MRGSVSGDVCMSLAVNEFLNLRVVCLLSLISLIAGLKVGVGVGLGGNFVL